MKNKEIIEAVRKWQSSKYVHPLTCGNSSIHELLEAIENELGTVVLVCPDCNYVQDNIPDVVYSFYRLMQ